MSGTFRTGCPRTLDKPAIRVQISTTIADRDGSDVPYSYTAVVN
jgi:hypothetical protein